MLSSALAGIGGAGGDRVTQRTTGASQRHWQKPLCGSAGGTVDRIEPRSDIAAAGALTTTYESGSRLMVKARERGEGRR